MSVNDRMFQSQGYTHVLTDKFDLTNVNNMVFYISGPKLLSNFEQLPVNLSCKFFGTLIRPILSYNCEIWYMDEYRAMLRAIRNNTGKIII